MEKQIEKGGLKQIKIRNNFCIVRKHYSRIILKLENIGRSSSMVFSTWIIDQEGFRNVDYLRKLQIYLKPELSTVS